MRFDGTIALISGAGSGIGRATAQRIAAEDGVVIGVDLDADRLQRVVDGIEAGGGRATGVTANVLNEDEVSGVVKDCVDAHGRVDVLVNAVGGSTIIEPSGATLDEHSLDDWRALLDFNLTGTFLFSRAVIPIMKRQRSGKIVNISSVAGRGLSMSSGSAYATAKGGIIALTRKLSFELGPFGIGCNAIAPGTTLTERVEPRWSQRTADEQAAHLAGVALGRLPRAEDQAGVICFLASRDADFVTGVTIDVNGGQR